MSEKGQSEPNQVIDLEAALQRIPGGMVAVKQMAAILVAECPRLLEEIRAGIAAEDAARVKLGAHTLRGSADVYAAQRVVAAARQLESLAGDGRLNAAPQSFAELRTAVAEMIEAIRFSVAPPDTE